MRWLSFSDKKDKKTQKQFNEIKFFPVAALAALFVCLLMKSKKNCEINLH